MLLPKVVLMVELPVEMRVTNTCPTYLPLNQLLLILKSLLASC